MTVDGMQLSPTVSTGGLDTVVRQPWSAAVQFSDTGELSLPAAWRTPDRGRQVSEAHRAVSDPGRGQTSECQ